MNAKRLILFLGWIFSSTIGFGQASLQVIVTGGNSTTSCTDIFSAPDPLWQVNVNNAGWNTYPFVNNCFNTFPHTAYSQNYNCPFDLPATIDVCFKAFENDGLFGCQISESCTEQICQTYPVPTSGQFDFRLDLPAGGSSEGFVEFSIVIAGNYLGQGNDLICDAVDLGVVPNGSRTGNALLGGYDNFCGTPNNDPNPRALNPGDWRNDAAVWFTFETDVNPSGMIAIVGLNDPTNLGDSIHLQMALFESSTGDCTGNLTMLESRNIGNNFNCFLNLRCPKPSTKYYVLVDGWDWNFPDQRGYFGIEAIDIGLPEAGDLKCDFIDLGPVPNGSYTATLTPYTNYCATNIGDPPATGFVVQKSVYFAFNAPPSGHVNVEVISDRVVDSIGAQIVIYRSSNDDCTGFFSQMVSAYDYRDLDESVELSCLVPGKRYFLLVDGDGNHSTGIFNVKITDLGDDTPLTFLKDTICSGDSYPVGTSTYNQSGNYTDTLLLPGGCDSVVYLDLTVLPPIHFDGTQTVRAIGLNHPSGEFQVSAKGGLGNFSFLWNDGQTGSVATNLNGGQTYCVTATDDFGCQNDTCFYVEYITPIIPSVNVTDVLCFGGNDGQINFSVSNGEPPYQYIWSAANDPSFAGNGSIQNDNEIITIDFLPAGSYNFRIWDAFEDTIFQVEVLEPTDIRIQQVSKTDASCFGECDGSLEAIATGGTGLLNYNWSNGDPGTSISGLCGNYFITVTDENQCRKTALFIIDEPEQFEVELIIEEEIACFGDSTESYLCEPMEIL
ncbi:MAG: SprB repeat-containing protein [Saprospiraceae bacterium]